MYTRQQSQPQDTPDLLEVVGQGAYAVVHRGWLDGRVVAVKVARTDVDGATEHLRREARNAQLVDDPRVATVTRPVHTYAGPGLVAPYLPGGSLAERLERTGPLAPPVAVRVLLQVAEGLGAVHEAGLLHRDVKPRNVLFDADGEALLGDLGSAVAADRADRLPHAEGSRAYLAPEIVAGHPPSVRADLYAWGATAYETLTGTLPPTHATPAGIATLVPGLPSDLVAIVEACLAADPTHRPSTATEVVAVLRRASEHLTTWTPDADEALAAWSGASDPRETRTFGPRPPVDEAASDTTPAPSRLQLAVTAACLFALPVITAGVLG